MTTSTDLPSPDVERLRNALRLAQGLAGEFRASKVDVQLNQVTYEGDVGVAGLVVGNLYDLVRGGHLVELRLRAGDWRLHIRRGGRDGDVTEFSGPISGAVESAGEDELMRALEAEDLRLILSNLAAHDAHLLIRVFNFPEVSNTHWIDNSTAIRTVLNSPQWVPFARQLASGPPRLLVDNLGGRHLENEFFQVYGPEASPTTTRAATSEMLRDDSHRRDRARVGQQPYPSPLFFAHLGGVGETADPGIERDFGCLTYILVWSLLAASSTPIAGGSRVELRGSREFTVEVRFADGVGSGEHVELYRWVATSPDVDRYYHAQQALAAAVFSPADAATAARPALRNAQSLYELSRRNSVAEVVAARRSAREIALNASRAAALQARDAAGKAIDRVVVQTAAGAVVVIAQLQKALSAEQATVLLALIAAVCLVTAATTDFVGLASARSSLSKEVDELDRFRDSISAADVEDAKNSGVVSASRTDLRRARVSTWVSAATCVFAFLGATIWFNTADEPNDPSPSPAQPQTSLGPVIPREQTPSTGSSEPVLD